MQKHELEHCQRLHQHFLRGIIFAHRTNISKRKRYSYCELLIKYIQTQSPFILKILKININRVIYTLAMFSVTITVFLFYKRVD